jgi:hypothetical protein
MDLCKVLKILLHLHLQRRNDILHLDRPFLIVLFNDLHPLWELTRQIPQCFPEVILNHKNIFRVDFYTFRHIVHF